jgi:hypothetical protein
LHIVKVFDSNLQSRYLNTFADGPSSPLGYANKARRTDQRGVYDCPLSEQELFLAQIPVDLFQQLLGQLVLFQQVTINATKRIGF